MDEWLSIDWEERFQYRKFTVCEAKIIYQIVQVNSKENNAFMTEKSKTCQLSTPQRI